MHKMRVMADRTRAIHDENLAKGGIKTSLVQFDELQTFEHTRMKPISVAVAIRASTGEIIDIDVAMMSPAGITARTARERYPYWRESRLGARESVFRSIAKCAKPGTTIRTDACDHYPPIARRLVPGATVEPHMSPGNPGRQLEYKCLIYGTKLTVADQFFPSSKTCSDCGVVRAELKLSERVFHCQACGLELDRDLNAAMNLLNLVPVNDGKPKPGNARLETPVERKALAVRDGGNPATTVKPCLAEAGTYECVL